MWEPKFTTGFISRNPHPCGCFFRVTRNQYRLVPMWKSLNSRSGPEVTIRSYSSKNLKISCFQALKDLSKGRSWSWLSSPEIMPMENLPACTVWALNKCFNSSSPLFHQGRGKSQQLLFIQILLFLLVLGTKKETSILFFSENDKLTSLSPRAEIQIKDSLEQINTLFCIFFATRRPETTLFWTRADIKFAVFLVNAETNLNIFLKEIRPAQVTFLFYKTWMIASLVKMQ